LSGVASAQSFQLVVDFGNPSGQQPYAGLAEGPDGCLYGTTVAGGAANGTIYRECAGASTTVYMFRGSDGSYPEAGLTLGSDRLFYGTTRLGGGSNLGTIFRFNPTTRALTTLFVFSAADGGEPKAELTEGSDGRLYGVASLGGSSNMGTVFSIDKSGSGFRVLRSFTGTNGKTSTGTLVEGSDGFWYGTTSLGGASGLGTIFRMSSTGTLTTLYSFTGVNGSVPRAGLVRGSDGYMYGTTVAGGANGQGTVYRVDLSGRVTLLRSFAVTNGANPYAELIQGTDGAFYGTTAFGGANSTGVVFRIDASGNLTVLKSLAPPDGSRPQGQLVQASNGRLYGAAPNDGPSGAAGTVFEVTTAGAFTRICSFSGTPSMSYGPLLQGRDGSLYGASYGGGASGAGTIFKLIPGVSFQVLHGFGGGTDGLGPNDGVIQAADGSLYVAAVQGGANNVGSVVRQSGGGGFTPFATLSAANDNGYYPRSNPVQAADGNFYGVMSSGGSAGAGTIYKMTSAGAISLLYTFNGSTKGRTPYGRLALATNGVLYGTTISGGSAYLGTVFAYDPSAKTFTLLHSFTGPDGSSPYSGLMEGSDGRLYGMTSGGGAYGYGTIFAVNAVSGALTTLHSFNGKDGSGPYATLFEASDGRVYGTASTGGASNAGSVFVIDKSGTGFALLHSFNVADGAYPRAGLIEASDGYLYGTAPGGGSANNGVIFRIAPGGGSPPPPPTGTISVTSPTGAVNWAIGSTQNIQWTHDLGAGSLVKVELSRDGGASWGVIAAAVQNSGATTGSYKWVVSGAATAQARIRVTSADGSSSDASDTNFTIAAPFVKVTSPNGPTDVWSIGANAASKWTSNLGSLEKVKIELSLDGGLTYSVVLASSTSSDGKQQATVKAAWATVAAKIRITWVKDGSVKDTSDLGFVIR